MIHRIWFSVDTKLPVRMEFEPWPEDAPKKTIDVFDQFEWNAELAPDLLVPEIPRGFTSTSD